MAVIPRGYVDALTRSLNALSEATQQAARAQLATIEYTDVADLRNQVIAILEPLLSTATDMAAGYAAQTYDSIREASVGSATNAVAHSNRIPEATERAVHALVGEVDKSGYEAFTRSVEARCDYEIKKAAGESTLYNAERDPRKPKWARVPTGAEACTFCLMLASREFVYRSDESAGALNHWHPHCDCRIVQGYPGDTVEGYDPDELYREWKNGEKTASEELMMTRRNQEINRGEPIDDDLYDKVKEYVEASGHKIHRGDEEALRVLGYSGEDATTVFGDIYLYEDATTAEVFEEAYHLYQEQSKAYVEHETRVLQCLREIDAQNFLLQMSIMYNFSNEEIEITLKNLEYWQDELNRYQRMGLK